MGMDRKQGLFDAWTPAHVVVGAVSRHAGLSMAQSLGLWLIFEVLENTVANIDFVTQRVPNSGPETFTNMAGDLLANTAGYLLVAWREGD